MQGACSHQACYGAMGGVTIMLCHGKGRESPLTHLQTLSTLTAPCPRLGGGGVVQLESVSIGPTPPPSRLWTVCLMQAAAVNYQCLLLNQMPTCVSADVHVRFH